MTAQICSHLLFCLVISIPALLFLSPHNITLKSACQSRLVVVVISSVKKKTKNPDDLSQSGDVCKMASSSLGDIQLLHLWNGMSTSDTRPESGFYFCPFVLLSSNFISDRPLL